MTGYGTTGNQAPTGTTGPRPVQGDPVAAQVGICLKLTLYARSSKLTVCLLRR